MNLKKINFKQKKYILPLVFLPFVFFLGYKIIDIFSNTENKEEFVQNELSTSLGEVQDSILTKDEAYDSFFQNRNSRSMLDGLETEEDSIQYYADNLEYKQKRFIDSLNAIRKTQNISQTNNERQSYYEERKNDDRDYQRSADIIRMLNQEATGNRNNYQNDEILADAKKEDNEDPVKILRNQMLMMDSLEKSRDPEYQANLVAEKRLKANREKMNQFLNSTLKVSKSSLSSHFNSITKEKDNNLIKAVIDENLKGYLGSRIRFRLLEDVNVGKYKISKGALLYGQISGFQLQRVNINIVSVLNKGEILPINLSVYDLDGMQGLYVPASAFREMMREMGSNSAQGTNLSQQGQGFFTSMFSQVFRSASTTIANIIRQNKVNVKYNSYIYLINDQELRNENNN